MENMRITLKIYISIILISSIFITKIKICDAGCSWINRSKGLAGYKLTTIAVDKENPNIIYVGSKGLLFKTPDNGENWKSIFKVPGINKAVNFIAIDPKNPKAIYVATESGIFKSEDGGTNWQAIPLGAEEKNVLTLIIDPEDSNTLFAGTERDIFISKDGGRNWMKSSEGLSEINIKSLAQNYIDKNILFASAGNSLFKSEDGGRMWTKIFSINSFIDESLADDEYSGDEDNEEESSIPETWISIDPFNPEIIYLSTERGVFKSGDNGNSWARLPNTGLLNSHIRNLVLPSYNKGFIFAATEKGVFRFSEQENMWREFYGGLNSKETVFTALNSQQDTLWLVTKNSVYKSEGDIYEIKENSLADDAKTILQNFSQEPSYHEIQKAAIEYAEVHPDKIAKWRKAAKTKALLPTLSFGIEKDKSKSLHWDAGVNPDTWVIGPDEEDTGWDVTCSWNLGDLIWNDDQTSIDVRSRLMVELRDDILDEVTHLYFERRKLQIELLQNPPKEVNELIAKELRLEELTAGIDAMTGGWFSRNLSTK